MAPNQDAKNLKASELLRATLDDYRALLIERWEGATKSRDTRDACHAGIRSIREFAEMLNDRIDDTLGDERD